MMPPAELKLLALLSVVCAQNYNEICSVRLNLNNGQSSKSSLPNLCIGDGCGVLYCGYTVIKSRDNNQ